VNPAYSLFEFVFLFLVQPGFEAEMLEIEHGSLLVNIVGSRFSEVPSEPDLPDRCAEHLSRIADLEGQLSSLKHQTRTGMEQAEKSSDLLKKVYSLEDQMSILMAKIVQLKECDIYMTEIIETTCEQLQSKLPGASECLHLSVFWIPEYPGPPAPGPLQRPSFGPGVNRRSKPNKEDPHEEAPHEENDD
jgi:hypothetical protein